MEAEPKQRSSSPTGSDGMDPSTHLAPDDRTLLAMRDELYDGSWERMEADLKNRRAGKPYVFRLVDSIDADLAAIQRLRGIEARSGADLGRLSHEEETCNP
jgi:hypothetical protein